MKKYQIQTFENIYFTQPEIFLPTKKITNDDIFKAVKEEFEGNEEVLKKIIKSLKRSFKMCGSNIRYVPEDNSVTIAGLAASAAKQALQVNSIDPEDVQVLVFGGISRAYYEPAVAAEVANILGIEQIHAFDVSCACSGLLEAMNIGANFLLNNPAIENVLCCSSELPEPVIDHKIKDPNELILKAGLMTLGSGAAAVLLSKKKFKNGGFRLNSYRNTTYPKQWDLTVSYILKPWVFNNIGMFELSRDLLPGEIREHLNAVNWTIPELRHIAIHQLGDYFLNWIFDALNLTKEQMYLIHSYYGNVGSVTAFLSLHHFLKKHTLRQGDKFLFIVPAGGFSIVSATASWDA